MKILQLGKAYPPVNLGGVEYVIKLLAEGLSDSEENIKCDVLGVNNKFKSEIEIKKNITIFRESLIIKTFSTLFSISLIFRLYRLRKDYDIIHIHHPDPMSAIALWLVRPNSKILLHWHSDILKQKFLLFFYKPFQNWLLDRSDSIIVTSEEYAKHSIHLIRHHNKIQTLPIGINESLIEYDKSLLEEIKFKYSNKKLILTIGRLTYYKGYEYLIDSVTNMLDNCQLLIVGTGSLKNKLYKKVLKAGLENRITFLGGLSDIEKNTYMIACDVFVLSSIYKTEAFAIVQLEAMKASKPIVSTLIPGSGVQWVNKDGETGYSVPVKDSDAISQAVNKIISDINIYNKFSQGCKSRFENLFTQKIMIKNLIEIYKKLV